MKPVYLDGLIALGILVFCACLGIAAYGETKGWW